MTRGSPAWLSSRARLVVQTCWGALRGALSLGVGSFHHLVLTISCFLSRMGHLASLVLWGTFSAMASASQLTRLSRRPALRGFSLLELAVVAGIIGILAAVALPTFLGQLNRTSDVDAQTAVASVQKEVRTVLFQPGEPDLDADPFESPYEQHFVFSDPAGWLPIPPYTIYDDASSGPSVVSVALPDGPGGKRAVFAALAPRTSNCWAVLDDMDDALRFSVFRVPDDVEECQAELLPVIDFTDSSFPDPP